MALFKLSSGYSENLNLTSVPFHEGYCYFTKDSQKLYIDYLDKDGEQKREALQGDRFVITLDLINATQKNGVYTFNVDDVFEIIRAINNNKPIDLQIYNNSILQSKCYGANYDPQNNIIYFNNVYKYDNNNQILESYNITLVFQVEASNIILYLTPIVLIQPGEKNQIAYYNTENSISGKPLINSLSSSDNNTDIPSAKAVVDYTSDLFNKASDNIQDLFNTVLSNYNESIIGLSVNGTTVTYIKGDGSSHVFETQDTDTTYSLGTDAITGLTKLYATTGNAEDGTMTQKAIKTELDKKVGVTIDDSSDTLIFTI